MPEPHKPLVMGAGPRLPPPSFADLVVAFTLLTPLPGEQPAISSDRFARACLFFPLVGLTIGALLAGLQRFMAPLVGDLVLAPVVVAAWTLLTLPTTIPVRQRRTPALLVLILLFAKAGALSVVGSHAQALALFLAPLLGRWSIVVLAIGARDANAPGRKLNPSIAFREFGWSSVFTGAVLVWSADAVGILIFVVAAAAVLTLRLLSHRFLGGVTWTSLCLCSHLIEVLLLAAFTLL